MQWNSIALTMLLTGYLAIIAGASDKPPSFKVGGQSSTSLALLVPKETTKDELKALVLALRTARRAQSLGKMIPPTTPRGSKGPYGIVVVYVYSEPSWATVSALEKCMNTSFQTPLYVECSRRIRAHYFYSAVMPEHEEGSVGYADGKRVYTKEYEKLF